MGNGGFGGCNHIQIGRRVTLQPFDFHHGKAEHLPEPGTHFLRSGEGPALLDRGKDLHQIEAANIEDGYGAQGRQHILVEDALDLRERALPPFLEIQPAVCEPLQIHRFEAILRGQTDSPALLFAVDLGVDALRQQGAGLIAQRTRLSETDHRVGAQGHSLLLSRPVVSEVPGLTAGGGHRQRQAIEIREGKVFASAPGLPDSDVCECHDRVPEQESGLDACLADRAPPATIRQPPPP
ncbi:hypothetical protein D9M68_686240 [compost metagenome]